MMVMVLEIMHQGSGCTPLGSKGEGVDHAANGREGEAEAVRVHHAALRPRSTVPAQGECKDESRRTARGELGSRARMNALRETRILRQVMRSIRARGAPTCCA